MPNTQPAITMRFEAYTPEKLKAGLAVISRLARLIASGAEADFKARTGMPVDIEGPLSAASHGSNVELIAGDHMP